MITKTQISDSISELKTLQENGVYTIDKLHWWLLKYEALFKYCKENWKKDSCFGDLPDFNNLASEEHDFFFFYDSVSIITEEHGFENYCKNELSKYELIKDDALKLRAWVIDNEIVGIEKLCTFMLDHLDYIGDGTEHHLAVFHLHYEDLKVFVDRKDFVNIIAFTELYSELFYVQKLYPERLEKIGKDMEFSALSDEEWDKLQ